MRCLREYPIHRCAVPLPQGGRLRYEDTAFLDTTPFPDGEGKEEGASPPQKEANPASLLGSPFQGKELAWTLPPSIGRRCPEGAEVGWGWRYEKERGRSSQVRRLREHPIHCCAVPLPQWGRLRYEDAAFLASSKRIQDTWRKRITTDKAFPSRGRWRAKRAG